MASTNAVSLNPARMWHFPALLAIAALALATPAFAADAPLSTVRTAINPGNLAMLPIMLAVEKGYFRDAGIDLDLKKMNSSTVSQMPLVARGDLDVTSMVAAPALFNQMNEGFGIVIIASMSETRKGWADGDWIMVRKDLWDEGAIRSLKDMKGHSIDAAFPGSPLDFLVNEAIIAAGLTRADVTYTAKFRSQANMVAALQNKAVDLLATIEPTATQMVEMGLAHRLVSEQDVTPWFQNAYFVASAKFLREHRPTVVGFLKAMLRADRDIVAHGPNWTPDYIDMVARWSGLPPEILSKVPGLAYYGEYGSINEDSLARQEKMWADLGLVTQHVDVPSIVDASAVEAARASLGIE